MSDTLQAVYDIRDDTYRYPHHQKLRWWLTDLGVDIYLTYRIEIHMAETRSVRVFQYDRGEDGRLFVDPATGEAAVREPFDLAIDSPPPAEPASEGTP